MAWDNGSLENEDGLLLADLDLPPFIQNGNLANETENSPLFDGDSATFTMDDYVRLRKENFDLKLRLYTANEKWENLPSDVQEAVNENGSLKAELKEKTRVLEERTSLLARAIEANEFLQSMQQRLEEQQQQQQLQLQQQQQENLKLQMQLQQQQLQIKQLQQQLQSQQRAPQTRSSTSGRSDDSLEQPASLPRELSWQDLQPNGDSLDEQESLPAELLQPDITSPIHISSPPPSTTRYRQQQSQPPPASLPAKNNQISNDSSKYQPRANSRKSNEHDDGANNSSPSPSDSDYDHRSHKSSSQNHSHSTKISANAKLPKTTQVPRREVVLDDEEEEEEEEEEHEEQNGHRSRSHSSGKYKQDRSTDREHTTSRERRRQWDGILDDDNHPGNYDKDHRQSPDADSLRRDRKSGASRERSSADGDRKDRDDRNHRREDRDYFYKPVEERTTERELKTPSARRFAYATPTSSSLKDRASEPYAETLPRRRPDPNPLFDRRPMSESSRRYKSDFEYSSPVPSLDFVSAYRPLRTPPLIYPSTSTRLRPSPPEMLLDRVIRLEVESAELRNQLTHHMAEGTL